MRSAATSEPRNVKVLSEWWGETEIQIEGRGLRPIRSSPRKRDPEPHILSSWLWIPACAGMSGGTNPMSSWPERALSAFTRVFDALWRAESRDP